MKQLFIFILSAIPLLGFSQNLNQDSLLKDWVNLSGYEFSDRKIYELWALKKFKPDAFKQVKDDEFLLHDELTSAGVFADNWFNNVETQDYIIAMSLDFLKYDFENSYYPLDWEVNSSTHYIVKFDSSSLINAKQIAVFFDDESIVKLNGIKLEMDKEAARAFLSERKDHNGNTTRELDIKIFATPFKANSEIEELSVSNWSTKSSLVIYLKINKVEIISNNDVIKTIVLK